MNGKCCTKTVIYEAEVIVDNVEKNYLGCTKGKFKTLYNGYTSSFLDVNYHASTALSTIVWENRLNPKSEIKRSMVKTVNPYKSGGKSFDLCLTEKLYILKAARDPNNINKKVKQQPCSCVETNINS